jgi:hypothetical protein
VIEKIDLLEEKRIDPGKKFEARNETDTASRKEFEIKN